MPSKVISGVDDVATLLPYLVAEADGWDRSTVIVLVIVQKDCLGNSRKDIPGKPIHLIEMF